jgi:uncharacterized membrane protein YccF (DUF307 family)
MTGLRLALNLIWFVISGIWLALAYAVFGVVMCLLVVTIPFGVASFRIASFCLWPFGRSIVRDPGAGAPSLVGNVLWFVLAGVWIAIAHVVAGVGLCLTIIGIPFGWAHIKLALVALAPLGAEIRPDREFAILGPIAPQGYPTAR